jgi:MFS family permease
VTRSWLLRVLTIAFFLGLVMNAIRPMASYQAVRLGADPVDLGIVIGSFGLLSLVFAVPAGRQVDRWGPIVFVVGGPIVIAAVAMSLTAINSIAGLAVSQAMLGLGQIFTAVGMQTLIANGGDPSGKDGRFGALSVTVSLGQVAGPALAGLLATPTQGGADRVFVVSALAIGIAAVMGLSLWRWPPSRMETAEAAAANGQERAVAAGRRVLRMPGMPQAMLASMAVLASIDILIAYLPAYGEANGLSVRVVGFLLSARAAASVASRLVMVPLLRTFGRRRVLSVGTVLPAVAFLAVPFATSVSALYVLMLCAGLGLGLGQPLTASWVASVSVDVRATALAMRLSGNRLAQLTMPALAGLLAGAAGLSAVFWALAALLGASAGMVARRFQERPAPV